MAGFVGRKKKPHLRKREGLMFSQGFGGGTGDFYQIDLGFVKVKGVEQLLCP